MKHPPSFTLIELMAATTVLSVVLLMMVGMQDQMSKAWSNANRRTDATREASAACRLMYEDLACLVYREHTFDNQKSAGNILVNQGIPFLYSSNGSGPITIANAQTNASYFFAVTARKPSGSGPEDLGLVGYYIASAPRTNVNGFSTTNFNLYRYYVSASNAVSNLNTWFSASTNSRTPSMLFQPNPATDEILARNTCNLRISAYNRTDGKTAGLSNKVGNGLNYQFISGGAQSYYAGNKLQIELSVYPEDYAQRIPYASWTNSTNIQKYARSYEFRVDARRD
jgi:type II secretory pathway component PulJ